MFLKLRNLYFLKKIIFLLCGGVHVDRMIEKGEKGVLMMKFSNDIEQNVTNPKAKRICGTERYDLLSDACQTSANHLGSTSCN